MYIKTKKTTFDLNFDFYQTFKQHKYIHGNKKKLSIHSLSLFIILYYYIGIKADQLHLFKNKYKAKHMKLKSLDVQISEKARFKELVC